MLSSLTFPDRCGRYPVVADCQHTCKDLSSTFLYQGVQYPNDSSLCIRLGGADIGLLAFYGPDGVPDLPPFRLQLGQTHNKRPL